MLKIKFKNLFTLILLFLGFSAQAVTVDGHIYFGEDAPAPGVEVLFTNANSFFVVISDEEGYFAGDFTESTGIVTVSVTDLCSDNIFTETVDLAADFTTVDFHICGDIDPPVDSLCAAAFTFQQIEADNYTVEFTDLSYTLDAITNWSWTFGDGATSEEQNPVHQYQEVGIYEVTLTISSTSCNSTTTYPIEVREGAWCNCPDFWEPVCIVTPESDTIEFPNICFAECEGFTADDIVECSTNNDCICPDIWDPVCVISDDGVVLSFGNLCEAECAGFTEADLTDCTGGCDCPDIWEPVCILDPENPAGEPLLFPSLCVAECAGFSAEDIVDCADPCICPDIWDPVCVMAEDSTYLTFGNLCEAECAGFSTEDIVDCADPCICPDIWDPVCVMVEDSTYLTFGNLCEAECAGFSAEDIVDCADPCICPDIWDPVCVVADDGVFITFSNLCEAECEGFTINDIVDCADPCICPDIWDPVCVATDDGFVITYSNLCEAECEGFTIDDIVDCVDPCICPDIWDPVCVMTEDSIRLTFGNLCEAECAGFTADDIVDCQPDCNCPDVWDPVCVAAPFPGGGTIEFPNACIAECEGFTPDMFVECDTTGCVCPEYFDPVCVITEDSIILTFDNECYAQCEGYYEYFYCDENPSDRCFASFYMEPTIGPSALPLEFLFTDQSWTLEGEITAWSWDFGDGETSDEQNPTHQYQEEGVFNVTLIIESSTGCSSSYEEHICVGNGGFVDNYDCQAMFFFDQVDGLSYNFQDMSFGDPISWSWDFGDGTTSEEQNPAHTFAADGLYVVTLSIVTDNCESTSAMLVVAGANVNYEDECFALFIPIFADENPFFEDSLGLEGVLFLNLSSTFDGTAAWDFGDGTTSTDYMPFHNYAENGTYEVTLTMTSPDGCTSTYTATVNITSNEFLGSPQYSLTTATPDVNTAIQKVTAYPNPTTNNVNIKFTLPQAGDYSLQILDINGRVLTTTTANGVAGMNIKTVKMNNLGNGMYFIKITSGQTSVSTKVVKN